MTLKHIFQRLTQSLTVMTLTGPLDMSRLAAKTFSLIFNEANLCVRF